MPNKSLCESFIHSEPQRGKGTLCVQDSIFTGQLKYITPFQFYSVNIITFCAVIRLLVGITMAVTQSLCSAHSDRITCEWTVKVLSH